MESSDKRERCRRSESDEWCRGSISLVSAAAREAAKRRRGKQAAPVWLCEERDETLFTRQGRKKPRAARRLMALSPTRNRPCAAPRLTGLPVLTTL